VVFGERDFAFDALVGTRLPRITFFTDHLSYFITIHRRVVLGSHFIVANPTPKHTVTTRCDNITLRFIMHAAHYSFFTRNRELALNVAAVLLDPKLQDLL